MALASVRAHAGRLTWLETSATRSPVPMRVLSITPASDAPRVLASSLPRVSLAVAGDDVYVASPALGVCRIREGATEQIVAFGHPSEIILLGGSTLAAVVTYSELEDEVAARGSTYEVLRIDPASGVPRLVLVATDRRPLATLGASCVWALTTEVADRTTFDDVLPDGTPVRVERSHGRWALHADAVELPTELVAPRLVAACLAGVLVADEDCIVRVDRSGARQTLVEAPEVDGLAAWRDGAAWIEGGTVWTVDGPGEPAVRRWESPRVLREVVVLDDDLVVVEDPQSDPLASMLGQSALPRSLVRLGGA